MTFARVPEPQRAAGKPSFIDVSGILAPKSIAVVGASDRPGAISGVSIQYLRKFGFPGQIWPVNPGRTEVHGLRCFKSVSELPAPADLAIIATNAAAAPSLVRECAAAGIRYGMIWAGGFAEVGGEGVEIQEELVRACRETGFALQGPNCIGTINSLMPMTATFGSALREASSIVRGSISMVSQSGGTAAMAQVFAQRAGFGFRYMISSGNEAVVTTADFIHAVAHDPHTKVIAAYIEGVRDGEKFICAVRAARTNGKPVVILKGGVTAASAKAAAAHTGALVGESRVWDAVFRREGVIQVHSLEQLVDIVLFLNSIDLERLPRGKGVAIVAFGGGAGVLSADQCARHELTTPALLGATQEAVRPLVPPIAAIANPIDLTPQALNEEKWFDKFSPALDAIAADPGIHTVLLQFGPVPRRGLEIAKEICDFRERSKKTVCIAWALPPVEVPPYLLSRGVHNFEEYERAIAVLGKAAASMLAKPEAHVPIGDPFHWTVHIPMPKPGQVIAEHDCHRILAAAGLAVAAGRLATSEETAVAAAEMVGVPVAMKGISSTVTHRAAAGLLALSLRTPEDVRSAYRRLTERAAASGVALDGVYVQHMVDGHAEVLISALRDPVFGVVVSCGAGGGLTELIDDVTLERAPVSERTALDMIDRLRLARAVRKMQPPPVPGALARYIARFSEVAASVPWEQFVLEVNPVKWNGDQVTAVDGLLIIEKP